MLRILIALALLFAPTAAALPGKDFYQQRRERLAAWMKPASLLVLGNTRNEHNAWPDKYFYYLTGIHDRRAVLLIYKDGAGRSRSLIGLRPKSVWEERWNGPRPYPDQATADRLGITGAIPIDAIAELLPQLVPQVQTLYYNEKRFPHPKLAARIAAETAPFKQLARTSPYPHLVGMRQTKDALELRYLQRAIDITGCALVEAMRSARPEMWEYELEALFGYVFRRNDADQALAFPSIVGSGPNSCVLHYNAGKRQMKAGDLVVLDVGAQYRGYAADVTRTIPLSGKFSKRQREIYQIVLRAQKAGIAAVRPGVTIADVHRAARKVIADAGYAQYFIHSTSHWLGLDVHDVGVRGAKLAPGMVLTVEPGIYIAKEALGVRIEDDVLVTADGAKLLSGWIPREVADLERAMAEGGGIGRLRRELEQRKLKD